MDFEEVALVVGMIGPVILTAIAFFSRKRAYATWAKVAYIIASLAGLVWGILGFTLSHRLHVTRQTYLLLLAQKYMCAGLVLGLVISVLMARPYKKRSIPDSEAQISS